MRSPITERVCAESAALRRLAGGLLDEGEVLQRTRIALWQRGGGAESAAYVLGVMRNVAAQLFRNERCRRRRELDAARALPAAGVAADQAVARHEITQHVANAVAALREPFREAVTLRFYEGLPPRTIARRLGVPVATVRSRIQRGLAALRDDLDRRCRDRDAWRLGLGGAFGIPVAGFQAGNAATKYVFGSWIMSKLVSCGLVVATVLLLIWRPWTPVEDGQPIARPGAPADPVAVETTAAANPPSDGVAKQRRALDATGAGWRVLVVDSMDRPVADAVVAAGSSSNRLRRFGRADGEGAFELAAPADGELPVFVVAAAEDYQPSSPTALPAPGAEIRLTLRDGPCGHVRGRILDPAGNPLAGVEVYAGRNEPPSESQRERGLVTKTPGLVDVTAADGTFAIDGVLAGWFRFIAMHPRYAPLLVFAEAEADDEVWIEKRLREGVVVTGKVIGLSGIPVAGATVGQGGNDGFETRVSTTAADGSYRTEPLIAGQNVQLRDDAGRVRNTVRIPKSGGPVFVWNPVLGEGRSLLRGRIAGDAVAGLSVRLGRRGRVWSADAVSDSDGRFALELPRGRVLRIGVFADQSELPLLLRDVDVSKPDGELVLELPSGQRSGRVTATVPAGARSVRLVREVGQAPTNVGATRARGEGAVVWDDVPGGAVYRVTADLGATGDYTVARFEMAVTGEKVDLGELAMPELAEVEFDVQQHASASGSTVEHLLERTDDNPARVLEAVGPVPAGPHLLPGGRYRLDVELTPGVRRSITFVVRPGEDLRVPVLIDARPDHRFVVRGLERAENVRLTLSREGPDGRREELLDRTVAPGPDGGDAIVGPIPLGGGSYRLEVLAAGGRRRVENLRVLTSEFPVVPGSGITTSGTKRRVVIELN